MPEPAQIPPPTLLPAIPGTPGSLPVGLALAVAVGTLGPILVELGVKSPNVTVFGGTNVPFCAPRKAGRLWSLVAHHILPTFTGVFVRRAGWPKKNSPEALYRPWLSWNTWHTTVLGSTCAALKLPSSMLKPHTFGASM
jgi:hypothetical protein